MSVEKLIEFSHRGELHEVTMDVATTRWLRALCHLAAVPPVSGSRSKRRMLLPTFCDATTALFDGRSSLIGRSMLNSRVLRSTTIKTKVRPSDQASPRLIGSMREADGRLRQRCGCRTIQSARHLKRVVAPR